ncbi:MAG TPA: amino acid permease, partial [Bacillota bacterium]|nr:amino acid permease [Bacillota bacterium]
GENSSAYLYAFGVALFGALYVWGMVLITFFVFRKRQTGEEKLSYRMPLYPVLPAFGLLLLVAIMITFYFHEFFRVGIYSGIGWMIIMVLAYFMWGKKQVVDTEAVKL